MSTLAPATGHSLLSLAPGESDRFVRNYEREPFPIKHNLANHPLFQMNSLLALVRKTAHAPDRLYFNTGDASVGGGWDFNTSQEFPAEIAFERIQTANAWMILKSVQQEPEYRNVLESFLGEVYQASGRDIGQTCNHIMSIIVTSPRRVTPYHMDGESNYLLQLSGTKTVWVFDGSDRRIVTQEELESFWSGNLNAATYRDQFQADAWQFTLSPGDGVHVPTTFPHWVRNGDDVSISVSINAQFKNQSQAQLHRINHTLRQRGLKPAAPGDSRVVDLAKLAGLRLKKMVSGGGK